MNDDFIMLKREFDSCQLPSVHDPKTNAILGRIAEAINAGEISRSKFDRFADAELGRRYFNEDCKTFMDWVTEYLACRSL